MGLNVGGWGRREKSSRRREVQRGHLATFRAPRTPEAMACEPVNGVSVSLGSSADELEAGQEFNYRSAKQRGTVAGWSEVTALAGER